MTRKLSFENEDSILRESIVSSKRKLPVYSGQHHEATDRQPKVIVRQSQASKPKTNLGNGKKLTSYKTILLGDSFVGKTSLFVRLTQGRFAEDVAPTVQMDIGRKSFKVEYNDRLERNSVSSPSRRTSDAQQDKHF